MKSIILVWIIDLYRDYEARPELDQYERDGIDDED